MDLFPLHLAFSIDICQSSVHLGLRCSGAKTRIPVFSVPKKTHFSVYYDSSLFILNFILVFEIILLCEQLSEL